MALEGLQQRILPSYPWLAVIAEQAAENFYAERPRWLLWLPVLLGIGIAWYFVLLDEPPVWLGGAVCVGLLAAYFSGGRFPALRIVLLALLTIAAGFTAAQLRSLSREGTMISRETGPVVIEGQLISLERLSDGTRLLVAPARIGKLAAHQIPARVRIKLMGKTTGADLRPGDQLNLRGNLMPPPGPVTPGGFDYGRMLWFERIGAVGIAFGAPRRIANTEPPQFWQRT